MGRSNIEWTDETWNALRGCSRISPGCMRCYAEVIASRFSGPGMSFEGFATADGWTRKVALIEDKLEEPLRWKKPRRIFVNSMSDFFHEDLPDSARDRMLAVMLLSPQHTFQVLTKRAGIMKRYLSDPDLYDRVLQAAGELRSRRRSLNLIGISNPSLYPVEWIWWGVSIENQETADVRIPELLETPARVRFVSAEPLLGPIELGALGAAGRGPDIDALRGWRTTWGYKPRTRDECGTDVRMVTIPRLDWVIVGGESGSGARAMDIAWARVLVEQCRAAGVSCFVKQLGAHAVTTVDSFYLDDDGQPVGGLVKRQDRLLVLNRKGGDPEEWPQDLRVREFPRVRA